MSSDRRRDAGDVATAIPDDGWGLGIGVDRLGECPVWRGRRLVRVWWHCDCQQMGRETLGRRMGAIGALIQQIQHTIRH